MFLRSCYGSRASVKFNTKGTFYEVLEHEDVVIADRGFQIQENLLLHFCNLQLLQVHRKRVR